MSVRKCEWAGEREESMGGEARRECTWVWACMLARKCECTCESVGERECQSESKHVRARVESVSGHLPPPVSLRLFKLKRLRGGQT